MLPGPIIARFAVAAAAAQLTSCGLPATRVPGPAADATPTPALLAGGTTYEGATFGYRITLPPGWRRSLCLSLQPTAEGELRGHDYFTVHSEEEEGQIFYGWQTTVRVEVYRNPLGLAPLEWVSSRQEGAVGQRIESTVFAGRPAAKKTHGGRFPVAYYAADRGSMFLVGYTFPPSQHRVEGVTEALLDAIATSFRFADLASPSPPSGSPSSTPSDPAEAALPRSPPEAAAALADALTRSDYGRLRTLIIPHCWSVGFFRSEGVGPMTPAQAIDWLRSRTAGGVFHVRDIDRHPQGRAQFQPRGDFYVRAHWSDFAGSANVEVDLMLQSEGGHWYWSGMLLNPRPGNQ